MRHKTTLTIHIVARWFLIWSNMIYTFRNRIGKVPYLIDKVSDSIYTFHFRIDKISVMFCNSSNITDTFRNMIFKICNRFYTFCLHSEKRKARPQKNTLLKNAEATAKGNFFKRVFFSPTQENFFATPLFYYFFSPPHGFTACPTDTASNVNRFE